MEQSLHRLSLLTRFVISPIVKYLLSRSSDDMRTSVFVGISLDGFLARKNDSYDFLTLQPGEDNGYDAFMRTIDCIVLGRRTYEVVHSFAEWPYGQRLVIVLSRTLQEIKAPFGAVCELQNAAPREVVQDLEKRGMKHAYIDGGATIQSFLREGLVQEITIGRFPVLIGEGIPLFGWLPKDVKLELLGSASFPSGAVRSEYRVLPS